MEVAPGTVREGFPVSDDFNRGYFGGGGPGRNREEQNGINARLRERREAEQARQAEQERQSRQYQEHLEGIQRSIVAHESRPDFGQPDLRPPPHAPFSFSQAVWQTAMVTMVAVGLWCFLILGYPLSIELGEVLFSSYFGGAVLGVALWAFSRLLQLLGRVLGVALKFAVVGALLLGAFYLVSGGLPS